MNIKQSINNRINEIILHDDNGVNDLNRYCLDTLIFIKQHANAFFNQYAKDNQLTVSEAKQNISSWDQQQFTNALKHMNVKDFNSSAKQRLKLLGIAAGFNRLNNFKAILILSIIALTDKQEKYIKQHNLKTIDNQLNHLSKTYKINKKKIKGKSFVTQDKTREIWSDRLWIDSDSLANDIENLVNKNIRHGMSAESMQNMLADHNNPKQFNYRQSIIDKTKQSQFNARRIIKTETSRMVNSVNLSTYRSMNISKVGMHYEPSACDKCIRIASNSPFTLDEAPDIPGETHPFCYCYLYPINVTKQYLVINPNQFNKQ